ncbi:MAG: ABC transporter substrate-binding protein [Deinococcus sp.]|nr:ABC transporter substrate-binding protein [Deinococcus sp.]MCL5965163.1 ABC transporter substrate-binding protein [Deinococcus sp.]
MNDGRRKVLKAGVAVAATLGIPFVARAQSKPVKFAALLPLTGPFAFAGNAALEAFRDATEYVNEVKGGIGGRKLELLVEDTGYDVAKGTAAFSRIVSRESPDELLFVYGDSTGLSKALAPEVARLGLPYSATSFSSELADPKTYPTIFVLGPTYSDMMAGLLGEVRRRKRAAKIALVYSNSEFGKDPIPFAKAQAEKLGMQIVAEEVTPLSMPDATALALKLKQAGPDFVIMQGYVLTVEPLLVRAAKEQGLNATFMGTYYSAELALMQRGGPATNGFVVTYHNAYWYDSLIPAVEKIKQFRASKGRSISYKTTYYMGSWFVVDVLGEAFSRAAKAGKLTRAGVVESLNNMGDYNADGLIRSMKFVNHRLPYIKLYRANVQDGRFDAITDWITVG